MVERNEIERLNQNTINDRGYDADYSRFFGTNHIIRNNYFHGTHSSEIGSSHTDCFQTYSTNGGYAHDILIEGNRCFGFFGQGVIANDLTTNAVLTDFTIKNNIFANDPSDRGSWGVLGTSLRNAVVVNNVFANIRYFGVGLRDSSHNGVVRNNIFYNFGGSSIYFSEGDNLDGDYNIIHGGGRVPVTGANDMVGIDPLFVDPSGFNFELQSNSPARDSGSSVQAPSTDIIGVSRPLGSGYDIGAYEYVGGTGTTQLCGNNQIDQNEACDGTNHGSGTCQTHGFDSGTLACRSDCSGFDTGNCITNAPTCTSCNSCEAVFSGCSYSECKQDCNPGSGCYYDGAALGMSCVDLSSACTSISSCSHYSQYECNYNSCGLSTSCNWDGANCVALSASFSNSITQHGITWTFSQPVQHGNFANGDYWVIGPVTIISKTPAPQVVGGYYIHGSMVNPWADVQAFDQRGSLFQQNLAIAFPYQMSPGESLISSISVLPIDFSNWNGVSRGRITDAAILTALDSVPPVGAFRPPYAGTDKTINWITHF